MTAKGRPSGRTFYTGLSTVLSAQSTLGTRYKKIHLNFFAVASGQS
jgi:hypothetical protein